MLNSGVLIEPMSCIIHGWNRLKLIPRAVDSQNKVLVVGAGIIGLLWVSFLHFKGLKNLWITQRREHRREIAKGLSKLILNNKGWLVTPNFCVSRLGQCCFTSGAGELPRTWI